MAEPLETVALATAGRILGLTVQASWRHGRLGTISWVMVDGKRRVLVADLERLRGRRIEQEEIEAARLAVKAAIRARRQPKPSGSPPTGDTGDHDQKGALIRRVAEVAGRERAEVYAEVQDQLAARDRAEHAGREVAKIIATALVRPRWGSGAAPAKGQPVHPATKASNQRRMREALQRRLAQPKPDGRKKFHGRGWRKADGICPEGPAIRPAAEQ